jgi:hypothetical protein
MSKELGYLPKEERKKVLLLCDDIRMHSGIATMAREFVVGTAHHFNWFQIAAAIKHPDTNKVLDISEDINKQIGIEDSSVKLKPNNGYGDAKTVREIIKHEKPDAIFIFTDPRYWTWLFEIEREIRSQIPIVWLNIWDDYPAPMYNKQYYNSVDALLAISKQTKVINELVLQEDYKDKISAYVPHGINTDQFKPLDKDSEEFKNFQKEVLMGEDYDYVVFFNSRNINRKRPGDVILSYRMFCDKIGKEKASKCVLILHTSVVDQHGTDLRAVKEALCDPSYVNVLFSTNKLTPAQMNGLYNLADVTMLISSNEGWGLSLTESLVTGTMIIPAVTGGMQDQCRFEDENGEWLDLTTEFPSNHRGTYKKCGEWAVPVFPSNIALAGSVPTPYIFDDRVSSEDVADALLEVYEMPREERIARGEKGRIWATSKEAGFTGEHMSNAIIKYVDETIDTFIPRPSYDFIMVDERPSKYIEHKLIGY